MFMWTTVLVTATVRKVILRPLAVSTQASVNLNAEMLPSFYLLAVCKMIGNDMELSEFICISF